MAETVKKTLKPSDVMSGGSPLILTARLVPVAGQDRFQPAGFPEIGHVIYKAPRGTSEVEHVCIVDSPASMANHLESVCMRAAHDLALVEELTEMPYLRCVTGDLSEGKLGEERDVVVTSLTEGHRIASTYFLGGRNKRTGKWDGKGGQRVQSDNRISAESFGDELAAEFGVVLAESRRAHPPASKWWDVFRTIFKYDPNSLVHGVLFPQWQIKISRVLTAHLEAFGATRVDRAGVKFDRLGKTTSGQPIFAVDDATAHEIRATFVLDLSLVRSFGRTDAGRQLGLSEKEKEFLVALALWKIDQLLAAPFRFRSGCHLGLVSLKNGEPEVAIDVNIRDAIAAAEFQEPGPTDVYWPIEEIYREGEEAETTVDESGADGHGDDDQEGQTRE